MRYSTTQSELKRLDAIELPPLESLPQTTCRLCGRSLINGLFTPVELELKHPYSPRCRKCVGDLSDKQRDYSRRGLSR